MLLEIVIKNKMKNSMLIAMEYVSLLPADQRPEHTEGYEGFIHLMGMEGMEGMEVTLDVPAIKVDCSLSQFDSVAPILPPTASVPS